MLLKAMQEFDISMADSILVGDRHSDLQAGVAAGVGRRYLMRPDFVRGDLVATPTQYVSQELKLAELQQDLGVTINFLLDIPLS
jgi:histidinol phosphatase-like enzyme